MPRAKINTFIAGDTGPPRMGITTKGWGASPPAWAYHNNYTSPVRRPGRYIITVALLGSSGISQAICQNIKVPEERARREQSTDKNINVNRDTLILA